MTDEFACVEEGPDDSAELDEWLEEIRTALDAGIPPGPD